MNEPVWDKCAGVQVNDDFINVFTYSGYRLAIADPACNEYLLAPDVSDEQLGVAVKESLAKSRFLTLEESKSMRTDSQEHNAVFEKTMMDRYGYKTRRAMYKKMKYCGISSRDGLITISPTHHEKLESWGRDKNDGIEDVVIPSDSLPAEIGAALRLAFSRCTG